MTRASSKLGPSCLCARCCSAPSSRPRNTPAVCCATSWLTTLVCPSVVYFSSPCALTPVTDVKLRAYEAGILPPLIQLLTTRERMVLQNSIATIRNLSFHPEVKAALMEAGAMFVPRLCRHVAPIPLAFTRPLQAKRGFASQQRRSRGAGACGCHPAQHHVRIIDHCPLHRRNFMMCT